MAAQQIVFQYLSAGSNTLTVPAGFSDQVLVYAWGAGGGDGTGAVGAGGGFVEGIITVNSGDTMIISVGGAGRAAQRGTGGAGGAGDNPILSLKGGNGANQSDPEDADAGGAGGGGGATAIFVNSIPLIVAAGGGGGGGYGEDGAGGATAGTAGGVATYVNSIPKGKDGRTGGAGGTGGGGGGYPYGGSDGIVLYGDDGPGSQGGFGGQNYANVVVTSTTLEAGSGVTPGGVSSALYPKAKRGYTGYDGAVIVIFTKSFRAWIKDSTWKEANSAWVKANGVWKQIERAWIKADNVWQPIQSEVSLVPVPSTSEVVTINLTIAANTNNYVLSDYLSATSYYPGRSIVNLTVDANIIVGSTTVGTPALVIDGLATGDYINLINNGNIAGAGGAGGAAGSYTTTGGTQYDSKGNPVYSTSKGQTANRQTVSIPGRPGEPGGPALYVTHATTLINNGTIAGGGGGGGGGGGPTGGQGGGGAGRMPGVGANNGTLTAGGAAAGLGGAGGARGTAGSAGTSGTNTGGVGGAAGSAIMGIDNVTITTEGTIIGPREIIRDNIN